MTSFKYNISRLRLAHGIVDIMHSKTDVAYSGSPTYTVAQFQDAFDLGDEKFDIAHYFDHGTGHLLSGHYNGEIIATLWNGNTIRLYWNETESYPYYYNGGFSLYWSNNTLFGTISSNMYQISTGYYKELYLMQIGRSLADDKLYIDRYPYAPWNNEGRATMSWEYNKLDVTQFFLGSEPPEDPYGLNENNTPAGGYGDFDYTSETDTPPDLPMLSAAQAGFVTLWNPTLAEVKSLSSYLWSSNLFDIATWQKLWNDPMETILSLGMIPVEPTKGARRSIHFGSSDTGIESTPITEQFVKVDFGSMQINGQSASYMDYSPYAKANLFLPYCGTFALDIDDIMDATISLEYHIDIYTGACVAYLTIERTNSDGNTVNAALYQFSGNVLTSIPVTASDHSQFLQSMLFMGASLAATVATSGAAAPAAAGAASAGALGGAGAAAGTSIAGGMTAGSAINTVMSMKPNVQRSGNMSSNAGMLGKQTPSITITWSNLCRPEDEYKLAGMPLHKSGNLGDFSGFTVVSDVHLANILCTEEEREMIRAALAEGVIV